MESSLIKFTKGKYLDKIQNMENIRKALTEHYAKLESLKSEMGNFWQDEKVKNLAKLIDVIMQQIERTMNNIEYSTIQINKIVAEMDDTSGLVDNVINNAFDILSNLKA